jgi:hypothetical protein
MQDLKNRHLFHGPVAMRSADDNMHIYIRTYISTQNSTATDQMLWAIQITNTAKSA